jgi:exodeoxyribonuclease VII small subunit
MDKKTEKKQKPSFELSIARLEEIVKKLEHGDVPLEDALTLFEEATGLVKSCSSMLDGAEQKVAILTRGADGEVEERQFLQDEQAK